MKKSLIYLFSFLYLASCTDSRQKNYAHIASGKIDKYEGFPSEYIDSLNIDVWLPDGFAQNAKYPVVYMHDGQMLFDSTQTWNKQEWKVDEVISKLIEERTIEPVIVVAIWNPGKDRHAMYFPQKPYQSLSVEFRDSIEKSFEQPIFNKNVFSDAYLKFITRELKPFIDRSYPTLPDQNSTFIGGSSMGGLISMYAICEYPEVFGGAFCMSTHWPGIFTRNDSIPNAFFSYLNNNIPDPATHKFYFDYGDQTLDSLYEEYQLKVDSIFMKNKFGSENYLSKKFPNTDHSEISWSKRLHVPFTFLIEK